MADLAISNRPQESDKKPRKRMKAVLHKIKEQMEFYFSDSNLLKDRFLKKKMDETPDKYVDLDIFLTFNRILALTSDIEIIKKALGKSVLLELDKEKTKVRRTTPLKDPKDVDERTVYVECLPYGVDHDWIRREFSACGRVLYVSLPKYRSTGDIKGFAFVEFETLEEARKACEMLNNPPAYASEHPGQFPKTSKTLSHLEKHFPDLVQEAPLHPAVSSSHETTVVHYEGNESDKKKDRKRVRQVSEGSVEDRKRVRQISEGSVEDRKRVRQISEGSVEDRKRVRQISEGSVEDRKRVRQISEGSVEDRKRVRQISEGSVEDRKRVRQISEGSVEDKGGDTIKKQKVEETAGAPEATPRLSGHTETTGAPEATPRLSGHEETTGAPEDTPRVSGHEETTGAPEATPRLSGHEETTGAPEDTPRVSGHADNPEKSSGVQRKCDFSENGQPLKQSRTETDSKKTKKRKNRPRNRKSERDVPELRVISKHEWLRLRNEYIALQKSNMSRLKENLKSMKQKSLQEMKVPKTQLDFVAGVIVHVSSKTPLKRSVLRDGLSGYGEIAYIDVKDGMTEGDIRCENPETALNIKDASFAGCQFTLLQGKDETQYWDKLKLDRANKFNSKSRPKKRGTQRLIDRGEKAQANILQGKHVVFADE